MRKSAYSVLLKILAAACLVLSPAKEAGADSPTVWSVWKESGVITPSDPSACTVSAASPAQGTRQMLGSNHVGSEKVNAWLFNARCDGGANNFEIQVHPDFTQSESASEAEKYGKAVGRLPKVLRSGIGGTKGVRAVLISKSSRSWTTWSAGVSTGEINILTEFVSDKWIEEVLVHEAAHVSLDLKVASDPRWKRARKADGATISEYAWSHPRTEDVAESFMAYFVVRYVPSRISQRDKTRILETIPYRIAYFDALLSADDMKPFTKASQPLVAANPVSLSVSGDGAVAEGDPGLTVTATLEAANATGAALAVPVRVRAAGTTATATDDYTLAGTISIPAGARSGTTAFAVVDDSLDEPEEVVAVELGSPLPSGLAAGTTDRVAIAIIDNDVTTVTLTVPDAAATKGSGSDTARIVLTLNRGLVGDEVLQVPLEFSDGVWGTKRKRRKFRIGLDDNTKGTGVYLMTHTGVRVAFIAPSRGASASEVALRLTALADRGTTSDESFTVSLGTLEGRAMDGGVTGSRTGDGRIALIGAGTVVVLNAIQDQAATAGAAFVFQVPADAFSGVKGVSLTHSAMLADGSALPSWLTFAPGTRTFSGTPAAADAGTLTLRVTADDGIGSTASDDFVVTVSAPAAVPAIMIAADAASVTEGGDATFTVTADPAPSSDLDVTLDIEDDAASDFLATSDEGSHTVTIPANQPSATLTLSTTGDTTDEAGGSVTATVQTGTGYTVAAAPGDAASVAVTDDDATTVTLSVPNATATEDDASDTAEIVLTLGRGLAAGEILTVPLLFEGGAPGTLFTLACPDPLPAGVTCQDLDGDPQVTFTGPDSGTSATAVTLSFTAQEDAGSDGETVTVSIPASSSGNAPILTATGLGGGATGARTGDGRIAITDDDPAATNPVSLSVSGNGSVDEGDPALTVTATLGTANATGQALAIPVQARAFGATASAADYTLAGTISIADGATSGTAELSVVDDGDVEAVETLVLELGGPLPSGLSPGTTDHVMIGIGDNDAPAHACLAGTVLADVQGFAQETANGDAHVTRWKQALAAFGARNGETAMTVAEAQQNADDFWAARWNPVVTAIQCLENAANSDPEVAVSGGGGVIEGGDAVFTVTATPAPTANLDVTLEVADAAAGDFLAQGEEGSHTVTVPANQPSATLTLSTTGDTTDEADGVVTATVQTGSGYTVAADPGDAASVVVSDDDATTVTLTTPDTTATEDDASDTAQIALALGRGLAAGESLAVPLLFEGGAPGTLFTLACPDPLSAGVTCQTLDSAPQVTFTGPSSGVSATTVTLSLSALDDAGSDGETVTVSIPASSSGNAPVLAATGLGGGATGSRTGEGQIAIADNDAPAQTNPVSLSVSDNGSVDEGDPALTVTATLGTANATGQALAIPVQLRASGTTAGAGDYTLAGTISIADGALSGETDFEAVDDSDVEALESVVVELGSALPSGLSPGTTDHVTIEVGDNDAPSNACLTGTVLADVQGFAQETANGDAHVTRWKQALAAFGARNGETAMTVAEAQQNADDFWAARWNPVVTAIQCLENAASGDPEVAVTGGSSVTEGDDAVFTVTADPVPSSDLDVTLDIQDDANSDFLDSSDEGSHTVTIPANQPTATLTLSTTGDTADEADGVIKVTVQTGTGYTVAADPGDAATVAVTDDDATTVTLTVPDATATEGDASDTAEIALALGRGLADGESLAVPLLFEGGAAGTLFALACPDPLPAGVTCQDLDGDPQVTFTGPDSSISATAVTLSFTARDDAGNDGETVTVSIPASSGGSAPVLAATGLGGGATGSRTGDGQIAIADDDAPASEDCYADVKPDVKTYALETSNGTAHVTRWERVLAAFGEDNGKTPMTVAEAQQNADDFWAVRWNPVVTALQCLENADTTSTDSGTEPEIAVTGGSAVTEGGDAVFTVTADPAPSSDLDVTLDIEDDAASDFLDNSDEGSHTVTISANQPSATLTLATVQDAADEPDGAVTVTLGAGTGYAVGSPDTATVQVSDDDTPVVSVAAGNDVTEGSPASFTVTATPAPAAPLTVTLTVGQSGDYATSGQTGTRQVTVPTGGSATVEVATANDAADEPDGSVSATVEAGTGYTIGGAATATVGVADDDDPVPDPVVPVLRLSVGAAVGEGGNAVFTVHADRAPQSHVTVGGLTVAQTGDVLDAPLPASRQLTLAAGTTSATLSLATVNDTADEPDGTVTVTLGAGTGYTVAAAPDDAATVAVTDDDATTVTLTVPDATAAEGDATDRAEIVLTLGRGLVDGESLAVPLLFEGGVPGTLFALACPVPLPAGVTCEDLDGDPQVTFTGPDTGASATEAAVSLSALDDADSDGETVTVSIPASSGGSAPVLAATGLGGGAAGVRTGDGGIAVADDDAAAVPKGPSLSVNDVTVKEGPYRRVEFTVTLSEASDRYVSFYYRVRESSPVSAKRGVDFWASTGKTFAGIRPGRTEHRIRAAMVIDDSHDEDPETFEVVLSDAHDAAIADAVGVATIVNDDPMPAAFLSRFGRTVAEQALDGIAGRIAAPREPGFEGSFAGHVDLGSLAARGDAGTGEDSVQDAGTALVEDGHGIAQAAPDGGQGIGLVPPDGHGPALAFLADGGGGGSGDGSAVRGSLPGGAFLASGHDGAGDGTEVRSVTLEDAMLATGFTATRGTDAAGGSLAFWGRADLSGFDGREGTFSLDGEAATAMLGADYARGRWLAGLMVMQSSGDGGYADSGTGDTRCPQDLDADMRSVLCGGAVRQGDGDVEASLTAAVPYAAYRASERIRLWGALGRGTGEVTLEPETGGGPLAADLSWSMAAAGLRGDLRAPSGAFPALAVTADALATRTSSDATDGLAASESDTSRLRVGIEGSWDLALGDGGRLRPRLEIGARHDGGDAETGLGIELGGGVSWTDPGLGVSLDLSGRTLVMHDDDDLDDRGVSLSVTFDPDPASGRGPTISMKQDLGGAASGGIDALFAHDPLTDRAGGDSSVRRTVEAAWGLPALGGRFTGSPHAGLSTVGDARDWTLGWRLAPEGERPGTPDLTFGTRAVRREGGDGQATHSVGVEAGIRW